ncbi:MAG: ATP-binding protein [Verrucomicrobiota bacterium]
MIFRSIRWRLQLWYALFLVLVLAGFGLTALQLQRAHELRRIDQELQERAGVLLQALGQVPEDAAGPLPPPRRMEPGAPPHPRPPGDGFRPPRPRGSPADFAAPRPFQIPREHAGLFDTNRSNAWYYIVWLPGGRELSRSASATFEIPFPVSASSQARSGGVRMRGPLRELFQFTPPGECVLVGRSIAPELAGLKQLAWWLSALGGCVLVAGLAGGWWLATRAIRPIDDISAAAAKIATGDLSHRISVEETDSELGRLAGVLNSTFARLESAFVQQARFTSDASHELRTPVSVILTQTQSALARDRSAAEYRETVEACQRAAQRMRRLTESLLELARFDAGQENLARLEVDLAQAAAECVELVRPLAEARALSIHAELSTARCLGDPDRLGQVLLNLLTNAVHYNRSGGEVRLITKLEGDAALCRITDTGNGIRAEDLDRIFERFYRADGARSGSAGHSHAGIGLAIAKAIVESHGGSIEVESVPGAGATFTVRLPAA